MFRAYSDGTNAGARDGTALALMFGMGMRRVEAIGAGLDDYDPESGALRIIGKGNRQRLVFATNGGKSILADWLAVRGDVPGPLLAPVSKSGAVRTGSGITPQALMYRLRKRCDQAGVKHASPHDLRRTFVSSALTAGADSPACSGSPATATRPPPSATTAAPRMHYAMPPPSCMFPTSAWRIDALRATGIASADQPPQSTRYRRREDSTGAGSHTRSTPP